MVLKLYMLESPGGFDKTQIAEPYTGGSHSVDLIEGLRICSSRCFQMSLLLPIQGPHLENHVSKS